MKNILSVELFNTYFSPFVVLKCNRVFVFRVFPILTLEHFSSRLPQFCEFVTFLLKEVSGRRYIPRDTQTVEKSLGRDIRKKENLPCIL